jgi:hypothetical protein
VAHACNLSYLRGWQQEDCGSRSAQAKSSWGPISPIPGHGGLCPLSQTSWEGEIKRVAVSDHMSQHLVIFYSIHWLDFACSFVSSLTSLHWTISSMTGSFYLSTTVSPKSRTAPGIWQFLSFFFFLAHCFIIHMCIQGLSHFSPLPPIPGEWFLSFFHLPITPLSTVFLKANGGFSHLFSLPWCNFVLFVCWVLS